MLIYLDTCIVIYSVEGQAPFQQRAHAHIAALEAAGYRFLVSDLTRGECLVHPLGRGDATLLLDYQRFFLSRSLSTKSLTPSIYDRAARIRGQYRYAGGRIYGLVDSLHLAAATEFGCDRLVTNDARLNNFAEFTVEILP
jgi:predicted nucleic acid-binding protein